MLVLVIEDEVDLATTVEYNLRAEGFQVRLAHSGRQGLASATADRRRNCKAGRTRVAARGVVG